MAILPPQPSREFTVVLWDETPVPDSAVAIHFHVWANDDEHAREIARYQYPGCEIAGVISERSNRCGI